MMNTKRIKSFRQGQTVYYVHALGKSSFSTQFTVQGRPIKCYGMDFLPSSKFLLSGRDYKSEFSLDDCNVIPNTYNNHRLFTSRKKAVSYLKLCLQGTIKGFLS